MSVIGDELISASDYDDLPDDPEECFVWLDSICQRNMNHMINEDSSPSFDEAIRMQYVTTMTAYAKECGISEVVSTRPNDYTYQDFIRFSLAVKGAVARIRFRKRRAARTSSVLLLPNTKTKIEHYIGRLADVIENSNLPKDRRVALIRKLDEFRLELSEPRLSFAKTFMALSLILAGLGSATTVAADGPAAVNNIMLLINQDRETEEAASQRLAPPTKALPAPSGESRSGLGSRIGYTPADGLDDDIPF